MAYGLGSEKEENNTTWAHTTSTNYAEQVAEAKKAAQAQLAAKKEKEAAAAEAAKQQAAQQQAAQQQAQQSTAQTQQTTASDSNGWETAYANLAAQMAAQQEASNSQLEALKQEYKEYQEAQYAKALEEQQAAIQAGVDQAVNSITGQKEDVSNQYADTLKQLYLNKMMTQKNLNQKLAAAGQTGGQAESTALGIENNYNNNLAESEQAKIAALSDLDQAITDAQLSGSVEAAEAAASNATTAADNYATVLQNLIAQANTENQLAASQASENKQYAYSLATSMLESGTMPSTSLLNSAGISQEDAQAMINSVNAAAKASGSGPGGTTEEEATLTKTQAENKLKAALRTGYITAADKALLEAYYGNTLEELAASYGDNDDEYFLTPIVVGTAKTGSTDEDNQYQVTKKNSGTSGTTV